MLWLISLEVFQISKIKYLVVAIKLTCGSWQGDAMYTHEMQTTLMILIYVNTNKRTDKELKLKCFKSQGSTKIVSQGFVCEGRKMP